MTDCQTANQELTCPASEKTRVSRLYLLWLTALVCSLILYVSTLAPDLVWQDQGDYQHQAAKCNLSRPGDIVRVHPLFILTAHLLGRTGLFSYAYAANLVSAVFTAVTVANVCLLVYYLSGRIFAGLLSAATFALAHSVWFLGVQAQTYSMANAALSAGLLLVIAYLKTNRRECLVLMGFLFGLGISAHIMSQVGFGVIMCWLLWRSLRGKTSVLIFVMTIAGWLVGAVLLWIIMAREYTQTHDIAATITSAVWGKWAGAVFNIGRVFFLLKRSVMFFVLNFPTPLVLLAVPGLVLSFKKMKNIVLARLFCATTVLYALFAVRYDVPNQNNFFLPMYMFVSIYIGLGFAFLFKSCTRTWIVVCVMLLLAIPPSYAAISAFAKDRGIKLGTRRHIPYRDVYTYYLIPWQHKQTGPRRMAEEIFAVLPQNAVILADRTTIPALKYIQEIEQQRPDLRIFYLSEPLESVRAACDDDDRIFTLSDVEGYYPSWVTDKARLKPFAISESENIFEITVPFDKI